MGIAARVELSGAATEKDGHPRAVEGEDGRNRQAHGAHDNQVKHGFQRHESGFLFGHQDFQRVAAEMDRRRGVRQIERTPRMQRNGR